MWSALNSVGRLAEAIGLPEAQYAETKQGDGTTRSTGTALGNMLVPRVMRHWHEEPVEWIEGRWLHFRRISDQGLLESIDWTITIDRQDRRCIVRHDLIFRPRGVIAALLLALFNRAKLDRAMNEAGRTVGLWAAGQTDSPFPMQRRLPQTTRGILTDGAMRADGSDYGQGQVSRLVRWIAGAQTHDIAPIRPLVVAQMWNAPADETVEVLLAASATGILGKQWLLSCPQCSRDVSRHSHLKEVPPSAQCPHCSAIVAANLARNVEVVFLLAPALKGFPAGRFAGDEPANQPGIHARVAVGARKRLITKWQGIVSTVRVRVAGSGFETVAVTLDGSAPNLVISNGSVASTKARQEGCGTLEIVNQDSVPHLVDLSAMDSKRNGYPARQALMLQAHRDVGGSELPPHGDAFLLEDVAVLATDLAGLAVRYRKSGDAQTFKEASDLLKETTEIVRGCGGSIASRLGDAIVALFPTPGQALDAARQLARHDRMAGRAAFRASLDIGTVEMVAHRDRQVLRGAVVERTIGMMRGLTAGELGLGTAAAESPAVIRSLQHLSLEPVDDGAATHKVRLGDTSPKDEAPVDQSASAA